MTTIHVVPHTHWDREWYEPFQVFRLRLVELVDRVLDMLEREPDFRFTLDGQLATIDDYLEVRPDAEERIRRLVGEGRLAIGPWQTLMDEFLVGGEAIVRNLQRGWARARDFGGAMSVGYLPDMFGHLAQMPQLLRRAGIGTAVVWRGVPASVTGSRFRWRAPDGSEVVAEYLVGGYGNGAHIFDLPAEAPAQAAAYRELMAGWYGEERQLAMYGTDHMLPRPDTVELVGEVNRAGEVELRIATLAEYVAAATGSGNGRDALPLIEGELRSGARANMLMGVNSAHVDIKAAAAHAERWLARYAEPLAALHGASWPAPLLELAWARVIDNSAHDSISGCSVDPVTAQVLVRFGEAEQIARGVTERALGAIAERVPRGWRFAVNPSPQPRTGLVELDVRVPDDWTQVAFETADGQRFASQEISRNEPLLFEQAMSGAEAIRFLERRLHNRELFGNWLNASRTLHEPRRTLLLELGDEADPEWIDLSGLRQQLIAALEAEPEEEWLVRVLAAPRRRLWALVDAPPMSWIAFGSVAVVARAANPVTVTENALDNGLIGVRLAADGTLSITRDGVTLTGVGRLVDGGDAGDSYNYGPPADDLIVDQPSAVSGRVAAAGPLVGELIVSRTFEWPTGLAPDRRSRRADTVPAQIETRIELRAGEPFVRLNVAFDNQADDHRLRFHVPLPERADRSVAEGQFALVERGLVAEGGHGEVPMPTFPAYGFVAAGCIAALLDQLTEYELVEDGRELALTLLRSFGWLSRNDNPYREDPAGPERAVPAGQLRGRRTFAFALLPSASDWQTSDLPRQAERYALGFLAGGGQAAAGRPLAAEPGLALEGDGVVLSALLRRDDWLELRLVNESGAATEAIVGGGIGQAREADLLGRPGESIAATDGRLTLHLAPAEIRTIQLRR